MHYTSVLFDLDGTLLDTLGDLTAAMNRTLTRHGLPERTRQQMRTALGNGVRGVTSEGKILVADPASKKRSEQEWDISIILDEARKGAAAGGPLWAIY